MLATDVRPHARAELSTPSTEGQAKAIHLSDLRLLEVRAFKRHPARAGSRAALLACLGSAESAIRIFRRECSRYERIHNAASSFGIIRSKELFDRLAS